eukprot:scaffold2633_cov139-Skeletonema_menzelii.AAC.9
MHSGLSKYGQRYGTSTIQYVQDGTRIGSFTHSTIYCPESFLEGMIVQPCNNRFADTILMPKYDACHE